jgi:hypothetical protein
LTGFFLCGSPINLDFYSFVESKNQCEWDNGIGGEFGRPMIKGKHLNKLLRVFQRLRNFGIIFRPTFLKVFEELKRTRESGGESVLKMKKKRRK